MHQTGLCYCWVIKQQLSLVIQPVILYRDNLYREDCGYGYDSFIWNWKELLMLFLKVDNIFNNCLRNYRQTAATIEVMEEAVTNT